MFFWQGKSSDELRQHRVGFAVRKSLLNMVERGSNGFERLFTLRLNNMAGPLTLVSVYAPTLSGRQGRVLRQARSYHQQHPKQGRTCSPGRLQRQSWCRLRLVALVPWTVWRWQDERQWPETARAMHIPQPIANSFFKTKPQYKVSEDTRAQSTGTSLISSWSDEPQLRMFFTRSYHSADSDTDHSLVCCKIKFQPKRFHRGMEGREYLH